MAAGRSRLAGRSAVSKNIRSGTDIFIAVDSTPNAGSRPRLASASVVRFLRGARYLKAYPPRRTRQRGWQDRCHLTLLLRLPIAPQPNQRAAWGRFMSNFLSQAQSFFGLNILGTLITAAFGAIVGAWVASRRETKRSVIAELNTINAARALCFSICSKFINMKDKHILPLHRDYHMDREVVIGTLDAAKSGATVDPIEVPYNLQTLTPIWLPIQTLERLVFEKISIRGRGLVAAVEIISCIDALEKSINYRNELIAEFKKEPMSQRQKMERYFGLRVPGIEMVDERFASSVAALYNQIDDCIFFSRILADDLFEYGTSLRKRFAWRYRLPIPKLTRDDWTPAETKGLMPNQDRYANWLQAFRTSPTLMQRFRGWVRSVVAGGNP